MNPGRPETVPHIPQPGHDPRPSRHPTFRNEFINDAGPEEGAGVIPAGLGGLRLGNPTTAT